MRMMMMMMMMMIMEQPNISGAFSSNVMEQKSHNDTSTRSHLVLPGKSQVIFAVICRRWILFQFNSSPKKKGTSQPNRCSMLRLFSCYVILLVGIWHCFFLSPKKSKRHCQRNIAKWTTTIDRIDSLPPPFASTRILAFWGSWKSLGKSACHGINGQWSFGGTSKWCPLQRKTGIIAEWFVCLRITFPLSFCGCRFTLGKKISLCRITLR